MYGQGILSVNKLNLERAVRSETHPSIPLAEEHMKYNSPECSRVGSLSMPGNAELHIVATNGKWEVTTEEESCKI